MAHHRVAATRSVLDPAKERPLEELKDVVMMKCDGHAERRTDETEIGPVAEPLSKPATVRVIIRLFQS